MFATAGPVTVAPVQSTTYTLNAADNPITFGVGTNINTIADAVYGDNSANWTVTNAGSLSGSSGVVLTSSSSVTNQAGGAISSSGSGTSSAINAFAIGFIGGNGTLANAGKISATGGFQSIYFAGGGTVTNLAGGSISSDSTAIWANAGAITVTNAGMIYGESEGVVTSSGQAGTVINRPGAVIDSAEVDLTFNGGGSVTNDAGASLTAGYAAIQISDGVGSVINAGTIMTTQAFFGAVEFVNGAGGTVVNQAGGVITAPDLGVVIGNGTITNAGTITGPTASVEFTGAGSNSLILQTGSVLNGPAKGSTALGAVNGLVLQGAGEADNRFLNFNTLIVQGPGAWTLGGVSTIGTTEVAGGSLIVTGALTSAFTIDAGATLQGSSATLLAQGAVVDNGTLVFDQSQGGTFANAISGSGSLTKRNGGALTLSGTSSLASTEVAGGSLIVTGALTSAFTIDAGATLKGSSSTLLAQGAVVDNGSFVFDQPQSGTFANAIDGSGSLIKQGSGLLVLNAASAVSTTTITGGELQIGDASHPGARLISVVTVNKGGSLSGFGAVAGAVFNNGGTVAVGSLGQLSVEGAYSQSAAGALDVEVSPTSGSSLKVTGSAALAGQLVLVTDTGIYRKGAVYSVVTGGSVSGGFSSYSATNGLNIGLTQSATSVTATVLKGNFAVAGATPNQTAIGAAFANYPVGVSDFDPLANALIRLPSQGLQNAALDQLGGEIDADFLTVGRESIRQVQGEIAARLEEISANDGTRVAGRTAWGRAFGDVGRVNADGDAHGFDHSGEGGVVGVQYDWSRGTSLGAAISYDHAVISLLGLAQAGSFDSTSADLYAEQRWGIGFIDGSASVAYDHGSRNRSIAFPGVSRAAAGTFEGYLAGAWGAIGLRWVAVDGVRVEPSLTFGYDAVNQGGFGEAGAAGADLTVLRQREDATQGVVGLRLSKALALQTGALTLGARVGEAHDFESVIPQISQSFAAAPGTGFTIEGADPGRDVTLVDLDLGYAATRRISVFARYGGAFGSRQTDNTFALGGQISF
jgi:uncharacterized protein with beta-barrel porin domain